MTVPGRPPLGGIVLVVGAVMEGLKAVVVTKGFGVMIMTVQVGLPGG
jgi:hypothetical protein